MYKFEITSPQDFVPIYKKIIAENYPKTIVLQGDLGAGKTTFVRTFIEQWDTNTIVSSPTFTLMNIYHCNQQTIHHFDLYRLSGIEEALELGFDEFIAQCDFAFIEWAERAWDLIPTPYTLIQLEHGAQELHRHLTLSLINK